VLDFFRHHTMAMDGHGVVAGMGGEEIKNQKEQQSFAGYSSL